PHRVEIDGLTPNHGRHGTRFLLQPARQLLQLHALQVLNMLTKQLHLGAGAVGDAFGALKAALDFICPGKLVSKTHEHQRDKKFQDAEDAKKGAAHNSNPLAGGEGTRYGWLLSNYNVEAACDLFSPGLEGGIINLFLVAPFSLAATEWRATIPSSLSSGFERIQLCCAEK